MSDKEKRVFSQELNRDDLKAATGGKADYYRCGLTQEYDCTNEHYLNIYKGGFPHCANTVEDGSNCGDADACFSFSVVYVDMEGCSGSDCHRSWR